MFSGIVEATGLVRDVEDRASTRRFEIETEPDLAAALAPGDSVAVDGACLTVVELLDDGFAVDVIGTTLARTISGRYDVGAKVNLERALRADSRLDGHLVQGHVDGIGELVGCTLDGEYHLMEFRIPDDVAGQTVERGSITINGVSLTVAAMPERSVCRIGVIPYTFEHTNLGTLSVADPVNVEGDLIGKYVGKVLSERGEAGPRG